MIKNIINKLFKKKKYEEMSFRQGFDLTSLPIVTFYQGEKKFNFLLDTGSNDSVIDSNILGEMEYTKTNLKSTLMGLDCINKEVYCVLVKLSYMSQDYPFVYIVNDMSAPFGSIKHETGVTLHGIIGSKFFNKYKYVLDFDEMIAYSKQ